MRRLFWIYLLPSTWTTTMPQPSMTELVSCVPCTHSRPSKTSVLLSSLMTQWQMCLPLSTVEFSMLDSSCKCPSALSAHVCRHTQPHLFTTQQCFVSFPLTSTSIEESDWSTSLTIMSLLWSSHLLANISLGSLVLTQVNNSPEELSLQLE